MSMTEERCIFPNSDDSIFSPLCEFPWYEERFGNHELPWKKWHIYIEKEEKGDDGVKIRRKKLTFQSIVRRIMFGRSIKQGIEGSMKGKMLMKADLPRDLELEVAKQIECSLPAKRRSSSLKGMKKTIIFSQTIEEAGEDEEDEVFDEEVYDDVNLEELEDAFDHFLDKLENLDVDDLAEMTSGVKSGLKSWLTFGSSVAGSQGGMARSKSMAAASESEMEADPIHSAPGARLRPLFRSSASGTHDLKFDEEMGPEMKPSEKALRASKALAELNKGDDKLTRKSEEQVNKITGDFCSWLRELPEGEDQTVNNLTTEKIKSLFDSTNSSKLATSKVVEGLRSWAKFGAEVGGGGGISSIFSIAKTQLDKVKVTKKFEVNKIVKTEKKRKHQSKSDQSGIKLEDRKLKLDHRQYGAWYLHPRKWENRFQSLSDPKSIEIVKARRIPRGDKPSSKQDVTTKKGTTDFQEEGKQLHSVRAFTEFLNERRNYEPPPFLRKALQM